MIQMASIDNVQRYQAKQKEQGLCRSCPAPATHGLYCEYHRALANEASEKIRKERMANGRCAKCGDPLSPNSNYYCTIHLNKESYRKQSLFISISGGLKLILNKNKLLYDDLLKAREELRKIAAGLNIADPHEKFVLQYRILSDNPMTMRALGKLMNKSHEWVRLTEMDVAKRLMVYMKSKRKKVA